MPETDTWWSELMASLNRSPWINHPAYFNARVLRTMPYRQVIVAARREAPQERLYVIKCEHWHPFWDREVKALTRLQQRTTQKFFPRVYDSDDHAYIMTDGFSINYTVMEYMPGQQLGAVVDQISKQWTLSQRVQLLIGLADCVQAMHDAGVIHRDLNFGNIMVNSSTEPPSVTLIDFGLALFTEGAGRLSRDELVHVKEYPFAEGAIGILAPEQALDQRTLFTTRTDLFAIGAIGYYLLVGDSPHRTANKREESIRIAATEQPRDPADLDPTVPSELRRILLKACARHPLARFAQARHLAVALRRWLED